MMCLPWQAQLPRLRNLRPTRLGLVLRLVLRLVPRLVPRPVLLPVLLLVLRPRPKLEIRPRLNVVRPGVVGVKREPPGPGKQRKPLLQLHPALPMELAPGVLRRPTQAEPPRERRSLRPYRRPSRSTPSERFQAIERTGAGLAAHYDTAVSWPLIDLAWPEGLRAPAPARAFVLRRDRKHPRPTCDCAYIRLQAWRLAWRGCVRPVRDSLIGVPVGHFHR